MKKFNLQSAKFNCGARKGKSVFGRLSLNFAICTLLICGAEGAKLCRANVSSYSWNPNTWQWAVGTGCGNAETGGAPTCSTIVASGTALCGTCHNGLEINCGVMVSSIDPDAAAIGFEDGTENSKHCFCRNGKTGVWLYGHEGGSATRSSCQSRCAKQCGQYVAGIAKFREAMLAF